MNAVDVLETILYLFNCASIRAFVWWNEACLLLGIKLKGGLWKYENWRWISCEEQGLVRTWSWEILDLQFDQVWLDFTQLPIIYMFMLCKKNISVTFHIVKSLLRHLYLLYIICILRSILKINSSTGKKKKN